MRRAARNGADPRRSTPAIRVRGRAGANQSPSGFRTRRPDAVTRSPSRTTNAWISMQLANRISLDESGVLNESRVWAARRRATGYAGLSVSSLGIAVLQLVGMGVAGLASVRARIVIGSGERSATCDKSRIAMRGQELKSGHVD